MYVIFFVQKSLDSVPTTTKARKNSRIGLVGLVNQEIPRILRYTIIVSEFIIFPKHVMLISLENYTHTHTHTHTYIYIYIEINFQFLSF